MFEDGIKVGLLVGLCISILVGLVCYSCARGGMQAEAVREGKAAYHVVDEFGRTEFRWNK